MDAQGCTFGGLRVWAVGLAFRTVKRALFPDSALPLRENEWILRLDYYSRRMHSGVRTSALRARNRNSPTHVDFSYVYEIGVYLDRDEVNQTLPLFGILGLTMLALLLWKRAFGLLWSLRGFAKVFRFPYLVLHARYV